MRSRSVTCLLAGFAAITIAVAFSANKAVADGASDQLQEGIRLFNQGDYVKAREVLLRLEVEELSDVERAERNRLITETSIVRNQSVRVQHEKEQADQAFENGRLDQAERLYRSLLEDRCAGPSLKQSCEARLKLIAARHPSRLSGPEVSAAQGAATRSPSSTQPAGEKPAPAQLGADESVVSAEPDRPSTEGAASPITDEPVGPVVPDELFAALADRSYRPRLGAQLPQSEVALSVKGGAAETFELATADGPSDEMQALADRRENDRQELRGTSVQESLSELNEVIPQVELAAEIVSEPRPTTQSAEAKADGPHPTTTQAAKAEVVGAGPASTQPGGGATVGPRAEAPASMPTPSVSQGARAEAQEEVKAGQDALDKADLAGAAQHFRRALQLVPGLPSAQDGLAEVEEFKAVEESSSLVDKIQQRKAILWQRADTIFRQADGNARRAVAEHRYQDARKELEFARQTVEANRANAEPPTLYEDLKREAEALGRYIDEDERKYEEQQVRQAMAEVEEAQKKRQEEAQQAKQQKVEHLMDQAAQLRREKRFAEAVEVLKQVAVVDPQNERARFLREDLEAVVDYRDQKVMEDDRKRELSRSFMEVRDSMVPWSRELMRFPKDWREISVRREKFKLIDMAGETEEDLAAEREAELAIQKKLAQRLAEIKFDQVPLKQVIEFLREQAGVNIDVRWKALQAVDIDAETPVTVEELTNVQFSAVLDAILDSVAAEAGQLGYVVDKGKITISTKENLNQKVSTQRYEIKDLLQDIPDFSGMGMGGGMMGGGMGGMGGGMGGMGGGYGGGGMGGGYGGGMGGMRGGGGYGGGGMRGGGGYGGGGMRGGGGYGGGGMRGGGGYGGGGYGGGGYGGGGYGGGMGGGYGMGGGFTRTQEDMGQELIELIEDTIAPGTWRDDQGTVGSIRVYRGVLIVTHTPDVQRQIAKLLKELREDLAIQIAIETSFLSISNNFLEEIGLDLDVILNAGNAGYDYATASNQRLIDPSSGGLVLIPRTNSRLGMIPAVAGGGTAMTQTVPAQPWQAAGLVPPTGSWAPHSGRWTPVGINQGSAAIAAPQATQVPGSLGGGAIGQAMTITGTFLDNIQVDFLIRATQADRRSSALQAPRIVVPQGRAGAISISEVQNYVYSLDAVAAGGAVGGAGAIAYIPQVSQINQGRGLEVTATVSPDRRFVTMTVMPWTQELLALRTFGVQQGGSEPGVLGVGNIQEPDIRMTTVYTTATVPDEGTLLVGGLKLGGEVEIEAGVPVLSKIPVLKRAFSNRSLVKDEQTLLILVKPRIIIQKEAEDNAFPGFAEGSQQ